MGGDILECRIEVDVAVYEALDFLLETGVRSDSLHS
jgi:hypothetical protein